MENKWRKKLIRCLISFRANRRLVLMSIDFCAYIVVLGLFAAVSGLLGQPLPWLLWAAAGCQALLLFAARWFTGVYRTVWRYANARSYLTLILSDVAVTLICLTGALLLRGEAAVLQLGIVGAGDLILLILSRLYYSLLYQLYGDDLAPTQDRTPTVIVGAGRLGSYLAEELRANAHSAYKPLFFIDNDVAKIGGTLAGLRIYSTDVGSEMVRSQSIRTAIIAVSGADEEHMVSLYNHYRGLGCAVKVCDPMGGGDVRPGRVRELKIEDLLFRKPIDLKGQSTASFYEGKTVLITGGGGSIGSELCRQLAPCGLRRLVIFDIYENNAYDIQQELRQNYGDALDLAVEIGSVQDTARLEQIFSQYRPEVVFHAAAHKHVPLMEHCGAEAVKNNIFGTWNTANMAEKYGVSKFILISTDKAVNPTNIMGATKRFCELMLRARSRKTTCFAAVRFGNVLGSNGSVVPLFQRQIEAGGPVTITDKRVIRYFMTIPEASQLVVQAGAMARSGELFVLDMGKPVRIYDLALSMIRLSGLEPGRDIEVKEIGLRPGEKLYEELLMKNEHLEKTENNLIFIEKDARLSLDEVNARLERLRQAVAAGEDMRIVLAAVVPTYHDPDSVNRHAAEAEEMHAVNASA
ncbi:MAG: polysaccharide biosynthesis protein [bacterium]